MGQQQLLLILLGLIIIALAIFLGINYFRTNAIDTKRNNVAEECVILASMAQQYYKKPTEMGGGGKTFKGWDVPFPLKVTANGRFEATVQAQQVLITGIGNEVVTGTDSVEVQVTVTPGNMTTQVIH